MKNDQRTKSELMKELESVRRKMKKMEALQEDLKHTQQNIAEDKRVQEGTDASEEDYHGTFETSHDGLLLVHKSQGDILHSNTYAQELLGYSKEEFSKHKLWGIGVVNDDKDFQEALSRLEKDGVVYYSNKSVKNKAGLFVDTEIILLNKAKFIQCNIRDNTARKLAELASKQAEEQLRQSEERFRLIAENTADLIAILDLEGKRIYSSPSYQSILGDQESLRGTDSFQEIHPDDRKRIRRIFQETVKTGVGQSTEYRFLLKDGSVRYIESQGNVIRDENGNTNKVVVVSRDVTEHRRAEQVLCESEEKFRRVVETALEGVWFLDREFKTTEVTDAIVHMLGYSPEELIGKPFVDLLLDEDRFIQTQEFQRRGIGVSGQYERRFKCKDGSLKWLFLSAKAMINTAGEFLGAFAMVTDITERKRTEQELKESKALIEAVVENVPLMIFLKEAKDLRFVVFNRAGEELLGYDRKDLLGRNDLNFFPAEQAAYFMAKDREVLDGKTGILDIPEEPIMTAKKGQRLLHTRKVCIKGADGVTKYLLGISDDITESKRAEKQIVLLAHTLRSVAECVSITDLNDIVLFVNNAFLKTYGYTEEEILGKNINVVRSPNNSPEATRGILTATLAGGWSGELMNRTKDGREFPVLLSTSFVRDEQGRDIALVGIATDITERKQAEEVLRTSDSRAKAMFQAIPDMIFRLDRQGVFLDYKADIKDIYAQSGPTIIGKRNRDITPPEFADLIERKIHITLDTKTLQTFEYHLPIPGSGVKYYEARMVASGGDEVTAIVRDITERKQVEDKLQESEERYKALFERSLDLVYVCDFEGRFIDANDAALNLLGYKKEEIGSLNFASLLSEDQLPLAFSVTQEIRETGIQKDLVEFQLRCRNGQEVCVESKGSAIISNGITVAIQSIARDITGRKHAEKALRESETKYRSIFENVQDVYYETLLDGTILEVSPSVEIISKGQYHRADLMGKSMYEFYPDAQTRDTLIAAIKNTGSVTDFEVRLKNLDGSFISCSISAKIKLNADGRPEKIIGSMHDISERMRAEKALRENEARLKDIIYSMGDWVWEVNENGRYTYSSNKGNDLFGYAQEEIIGKTPFDFMPPEEAERVSPMFSEILSNKAPIKDLENWNIGKNGERFCLLTNGVPILDEQGNMRGYRGVDKDITDRKRKEEELKFKNIILSTQQEVSRDGILVIDEHGKILSFNHQFITMWGVTSDALKTNSDELVLKSVMENLEEPQRFMEQVNYLYAHWTETSSEEIVLKDGRILDRYSAPMLGLDEKYYGRVWFFRDITTRRRAEELLRETTDYLDNLLSFANAPIMVWDHDNRITKFNLAFERLTKYTIYDVVGKHPEILFPVDTRNELSDLISRTSDGENMISVEIPVRCKDGSVRIVIWNTANIYAADDKTIIATIAHGQDITKRKQAEEELSESETRYRSVLQSATDGIITADSSGIIIGWNSGAERIFGYNYTEAVGQSLTSLMPLFYQAGHTSGMERVLSGGDKHVIGKTVELEGLRKDKSAFPIELSLSTWESKSGRFFTGIIRDITERKRTEELILESELRFRSLYENATIGIYRTTPHGEILLANPTLVKMLGYTSFEKLTERNLEKDGFEPSYQRKEFVEKIERDGEINGNESKWTRQDGSVVYVLESARAIRDAQGKTLYYDGTVEDITNHRQLEEQVRQMQKLESLGTLAGGIAHDFNNILGIILAYVTTIIRLKDDPEKLDQSVDTISKAVQRGAALVRQILTFARKSDVEFELININNVAKEVIEMILETFPRTLSYSQNLQNDMPAIYADRSQIHQALLNLCVNARDAMPDGGVLTINTSIVDGMTLHIQHPDALASPYICVEVSDTGTGMTDEIRQKIFEPFFTTKEKGKGTGLGLAVVFGVVQTHKGFIEVESELGKGTTFRWYIPVPSVMKPAHAEIQELVKEIPGGTETLLVVEDEETMMMFIQMSLAAKGYTVISAVDGPEAVKNYRERQNEISLVFTDLGLPGMTGMEEVNIIRKINPEVKIIVATGYLDPEMKSELLKAGVKRFVLKPYDFEEILKLMREVLDEK